MITTKRTKRKHVLFTQAQWERVCERAKYLKMMPATYLRNMSLHKEWKNTRADDFCQPLT
ncbi:plasmid mobilization protein [Huintestinicola sp.]